MIFHRVSPFQGSNILLYANPTLRCSLHSHLELGYTHFAPLVLIRRNLFHQALPLFLSSLMERPFPSFIPERIFFIALMAVEIELLCVKALNFFI